MFNRSFPWRYIGFFFLACLAAAGFYAFPRSPARAVVQPSSRKEIANFSSKITVTYRIFNEGGQDLVLGDVTTTCGCSVASIQPTTVKPGSYATVVVEGTPPSAGEKFVEIRVNTNSPGAEIVVIGLTVLSAIFPESRCESKQPIHGGLNFGFGHPRMENRLNFLSQQLPTPRPAFVRVAGTAAGCVPR